MLEKSIYGQLDVGIINDYTKLLASDSKRRVNSFAIRNVPIVHRRATAIRTPMPVFKKLQNFFEILEFLIFVGPIETLVNFLMAYQLFEIVFKDFLISFHSLRAQFLNACCLVLDACCLMLDACVLLAACC